MIPEISEFSYGFALSNELVGWLDLSAAPIFPSLLEEGKAGGGYDVKFNQAGSLLYLQFKRAECMKFPNAKQFKQIIYSGQTISLPFFRFYLMRKSYSQQHEMLLELDNGSNAVFYAAPRFYTSAEIDDAWSSKTVAEESIFVAPSAIGELPDDENHCVAYDESRAYFCSSPRPLEALGLADLQDYLSSKVKQEKRSLREVIDEALSEATEIVERGGAPEGQVKGPEIRIEGPQTLQRSAGRMPPGAIGYQLPERVPASRVPIRRERPRVRTPRGRLSEEQSLEELAAISMRNFGAQLIVVQTTEK